jgi:rhomboid family GlyGly-CTERM serine protease
MKIVIGKIIVFLAVTAAVLFCTANPGAFICTRDGIAFGEYWRLFTGHFVHFTREHLITNVVALGLLLSLMQRVTAWKTFWLCIATPLLLGGALYLARPELAAYGGLSGWISALFMAVAVDQMRQKSWVGYLFRISVVLFVVKIAVEFSLGRSFIPHFAPGIMVEPAAHAMGAVIALIGMFLDPRQWANRPSVTGSSMKCDKPLQA